MNLNIFIVNGSMNLYVLVFINKLMKLNKLNKIKVRLKGSILIRRNR